MTLDERAWAHEQYVRCYTLGHSWFDYDTDKRWKTDIGETLTLRCERCGTERRDIISDVSGQVLVRAYTYPEGYQYRRGEGRPTRSEFRLSLLAARIQEAREARRAARTA